MLLTLNFPDTLDPRFKEIFVNAFRERDMVFQALFSVQTSTRSLEKVSGISGFDQLVYTPEGSNFPYGSFEQLYDKTFTHVKFGRSAPIARELVDDDRHSAIERGIQGLGRAARNTIETLAASVFNNAFSTTAVDINGYTYDPTLPDGKALCADDHPRSPTDSTAVDNKLALALSYDNLVTAQTTMKAMRDPKGEPIAFDPDILLVPPALYPTAKQIVDGKYEVDTSSNLNIFRGKLNVIEWAHLTDTNAWFLLDSLYMKDNLIWFWRRPIETGVTENMLADTWEYRVDFRASYGVIDPRFVVGSNPS